MQLSFYKNITTTAGNQLELSHEQLVEYLNTHLVRPDKDGPLYSPALYRGEPQRMDSNVIGMSAVVMDFDNTEWIVENGKKKAVKVASPSLPEDHEDNLDGTLYLWHSTHSNKEDWPKWRLVLPLSRIVHPGEWPAVYAGALSYIGNDPNVDQTSRDLSRAYYLPSCSIDQKPFAFWGVNDGEPIDADHLIEISGEPVQDWSPGSQIISSTGPRTAGRNDALKRIVSACLERGEAFEKIVFEVLTADALHEPPLFEDPSETQYMGLPKEVAAISFVSRIMASHARNATKQGRVPDIPHIRSDAAYAAPPVVEIDTAVKAPEIMPLPAHLLNPPGMLGDMAKWIEKCALLPQPVLALAASIAACGVLMGRKVQGETGLRTNVFVVGIAESSAGKENARQRIKELFVNAGCQRMLGPEDIASDSGLLRAVKVQPSQLLQIDEIGYMLKSVKADSSKSYKADIVPTLMKLDSAASSVMIGKSYADKEKEREDIIQPCVCIYGTSVPCRFLAALTPNEIIDGFIPRMLVFESDNPNPWRRERDVDDLAPPHSLVARLQTWRDRPTIKGNLADFQPDSTPSPKVVRFSDEARALFKEMEKMVREEKDKARSKGLNGLWGKTEAQAMQLALIYSCSQSFDAEAISAEAAMWAIELVLILTRNMLLRAEQHISSNQTESEVKKILREITAAGAAGISRRDLARKNRAVRANVVKDILKALSDDGEIFMQVEGKSEIWRNALYLS